MEIKDSNIKAAYEAADEKTREVLRALFPEQLAPAKDDRPVTERVKTFEDACEALGIEADTEQAKWEAAGLNMPDEIAYQKLRIITAALNEGWEPQFTEDEYRYYPWHYLWTAEELSDKDDDWKQARNLQSCEDYRVLFGGYAYDGADAGFAFASSYYAPSNAYAPLGSRLCFKSSDLAAYAGRQFIRLYMDFNLIRK